MKQNRIRPEVAPWLAHVALGAVPFAAAACMVGPDYEPPSTAMPAQFREASDTATPSTVPTEIRWWRQLGDARLTELVEKAVTANHGIAVAQARLREARAVRQVAQSLLYPQLGVGASALRYRTSPAATPGVSVQEDSLFQIGFDASWVVDLFGGTRREVEAAQASEEAAAAGRRGVVLVVAAETARAYLELRGVQRQLQLDLDILQQQRQTLGITEDRRRAGLASDLEVLRARTEVEGTAAEIPPLQQGSRHYIHLLSTLLGLEPTALSAALEAPAALPAVPEQIAVGIPSDLLRRRPDIAAAERQLAAATAQVGVATAQLFPRVVLGASAGFASREIGDLFNSNSNTDPSSYYLAGPSIDWTLFDGGRRRAGIEFAEARVDAAKASYQDTVLRAFREVESSLVAVDRARVRITDLDRLAATARQSADIARRDYERGILDQLTVLDAQRQANRAELLLSDGQVSLLVNVITLYKALGGGWEVAEPASGEQAVPITRNEGTRHENQ
jgi:NodT family efflux transporter outer membrane factor (OMF) lipoprotein